MSKSWMRGLFSGTPTPTEVETPPNRRRTTREDDQTASHTLHAVVHEVTVTSRAAARTLKAKAIGLAREATLTRESLVSGELEADA